MGTTKQTISSLASCKTQSSEVLIYPLYLQSLYCGNAVGNQMIQVTPKEVRLLSAAQKQLVHQWRPPDGLQINVAAGNPSQVMKSPLRIFA